jgi:hypothetical protein
MKSILLSGTFSVGWSEALCQFHPSVVGVHPDFPDDPFALLMHRINALKTNPSSCIVVTTFADTVQDARIQKVVTDLAESLLPDREWTEIVLHAHQNEFFDRCVHHHGYADTFDKLMEDYKTSPVYFRQPDNNDVQHVNVPQYIADTPDMMCAFIDKLLHAT